MGCIIDIDRPDTWPAAVREETARMAEQLVGTTKHTGDLELPNGYDDEFRQLLAGHRLRAYHATRLLPHEIHDVRDRGLDVLTVDLVDRRLTGLHASGVVTDDDLEDLRASTVFALDEYQNRHNQICLFLGQDSFSHQGGLWRLLETWGGEAIFSGIEHKPDLLSSLRSAGRPAVVVVQLEGLESGWRTHAVYPELPKNFIAKLLELDGRGADVFYQAAIPSNRIEDVWLPGHPQFDRHLDWIDE